MSEQPWAERLRQMSCQERARRGAELLDRECPGWADRIDVDALTIGNRKLDILGQLYGDYYDGCRALGLSTTDPWPKAELGFTWDTGFYHGPLWAAWRDLIAERRAKASA